MIRINFMNNSEEKQNRSNNPLGVSRSVKNNLHNPITNPIG